MSSKPKSFLPLSRVESSRRRCDARMFIELVRNNGADAENSTPSPGPFPESSEKGCVALPEAAISRSSDPHFRGLRARIDRRQTPKRKYRTSPIAAKQKGRGIGECKRIPPKVNWHYTFCVLRGSAPSEARASRRKKIGLARSD